MKIWRTSIQLPWWGAALLGIGIVGSLLGALLVAGFLYVAFGFSSALSSRGEARKNAGNFRFVDPNTAVLDLRSEGVYSWEIQFVDADVLPTLGDSEVTVLLVNHDSHAVNVSWNEVGADGFMGKPAGFTLHPGKRVRFWSGRYGGYHEIRSNPWFRSDPEAVHNIEMILKFKTPPATPIEIEPILYAPI